MATLQLPAHHLGLAIAQAGADVLAATANATASVAGYSFAVRLRNRASLPGFGTGNMAPAQSRNITVIAALADVAGAPVDLFDGDRLAIDDTAYTIAVRTDDAQLGQTTLQLEQVP